MTKKITYICNLCRDEWKKDLQTGVEKDEFNLILKNCLGKLPEKTSAVFILKNMEDLESDEICKELQITPSNYWVLMHRAKLQLRECIELNWFRKQQTDNCKYKKRNTKMIFSQTFKMSCRDATYLHGKQKEGKLSFTEALGLKICFLQSYHIEILKFILGTAWRTLTKQTTDVKALN